MSSPAPYSLAFVALLAGCNGVLGIEELPRADPRLPATTTSTTTSTTTTSSTGSGGCSAPDAGCDCVAREERCTGNVHEICTDAGQWVEAACPADAPICSASSCTAVTRLVGGLGEHTCVVLGDETVRCWGWNGTLHMGAPFDGEDVRTPVPVAGIAQAQRGTTSRGHTCFALADGSARCWGRNDFAQLGHGPSGLVSTDPVVVDLTEIEELADGRDHTCARRSNGDVHCWGDNSVGQLGRGSVGSGEVAPGPPVALPKPATNICTGTHFSCAVLQDTSMWCWGSNAHGVLGEGTTDMQSGVPVQALLTGVVSVACGDIHMCARTDTEVLCWGDNGWGQAGTGPDNSPKPVAIEFPPGGPPVQHCAEYRHACARRDDGNVLCWGKNASAQLGNGDTDEIAHPQAGLVIALPAPAKDLSCWWLGGCALLEDGTVHCWGDGNHGQLGDGLPHISGTPTEVVWSD